MAYDQTRDLESADLPEGADARRGMILARTQELCDDGGAKVVPCVDPTRPSDGPAVLYRPDQLVTTDVDRLTDALRRQGARIVEVLRQTHAAGLPYSLVQIEGADPLDVVHELGRLDFEVSPNHILTQGQHIFYGPGSDPVPAAPAEMSTCEATDDGWDYRVAIIDTGVLKDADTPFSVAGHTVEHAKDFENPDIDGDDVIDHRGGAHGTFIAGVLESRVPGIGLRFDDAFDRNGDVPVTDEWSFTVQLSQAIADKEVKVINLSLGTYALQHIRPELLEAAMRWAVARRDDVLFVCAAGNGARPDRWFPAGFADQRGFEGRIVSVGALESLPGGASRAAEFSNYGPWVNAWAPGVDLVSYYATDKIFVYHDSSGAPAAARRFKEGFARWSGTSFAAPYAAGDIVRHAIDHTGGDAVAAWRDLSQNAPFVVF